MKPITTLRQLSASGAIVAIVLALEMHVQAALSEAARKIDEEIATNRGFPVQVGE